QNPLEEGPAVLIGQDADVAVVGLEGDHGEGQLERGPMLLEHRHQVGKAGRPCGLQHLRRVFAVGDGPQRCKTPLVAVVAHGLTSPFRGSGRGPAAAGPLWRDQAASAMSGAMSFSVVNSFTQRVRPSSVLVAW